MTEKTIQKATLAYPRGKGRVRAEYRFREIYNFYKERWGDNALDKATVHKIYSKLFPTIVKMMVFDNLDFRMPAKMGYIRVRKKPTGPKIDYNGKLNTRGMSIDWKATKKLWQKMYPDKTAEELKDVSGKPVIREMNDHTNGYRLVWYWDKVTCNVKNQNAYYINMTRTNDQILSRGAKMNNLNFYT